MTSVTIRTVGKLMMRCGCMWVDIMVDLCKKRRMVLGV
jgi:hypothetical protein